MAAGRIPSLGRVPGRRFLISGVLLAGCATGTAGVAHAHAGTASVRLQHINFGPHTLHVAKGTKVTWLFRDQYVVHNVTSVGAKRFASSHNQMYQTSYAVTFGKPGVYKYVCTLHPGMKGKIVVGK